VKLNLTKLLKKKKMTPYRLSGLLGINPQNVYQWTYGKALPSKSNMDNICYVLECGIEDLLKVEDVAKELKERVRLYEKYKSVE
jgi:DNA-binding Xre family transcriptional regulator